jgi:serine/threonine-protein kinase SRPK3
LLTGQILFRPPPLAALTADESLLLLQYALTGETLDKKLVQQSRVKNQYFDLDGKLPLCPHSSHTTLNHIYNKGNLIKAKMNPYTHQTLEQLLSQHTDLAVNQVKAAARFIKDCLRLNPGDRLNIEQLEVHSWLETAFMGGADEAPVADQHSAL